MSEQVPTPGAPERSRRGSFGPTVLAGLAGAGLAVVGASQVWWRGEGDSSGTPVRIEVKGSEAAPLVAALAFVLLAAWGVLLVTRGRVRQAVAGCGALIALGMLVALGVGWNGASDTGARMLSDRGVDTITEAGRSSWYAAAALGALLTLLALLQAVRRSGSWPSMGSRYDAPGSRTEESHTPAGAAGNAQESASERDLWDQLNDGHDPTDPGSDLPAARPLD